MGSGENEELSGVNLEGGKFACMVDSEHGR